MITAAEVTVDIGMIKCDTLRDLVLFVQFKKM